MTTRPLNLLTALLLLLCVAAAEMPSAGGTRPLVKLIGPAGTAAAFSRDGKLILTAGGDEARVWDAQTFKPVTKPLKHDERVLMACLSPDGTRVLTCSGPQAVLWDTRTGERLRSLKHPAELRCASFGADGSKLVTGCEDGKARVWDATSGAVLSTYAHAEPVQWARLLPDGSMLVTFTARTKLDPDDARGAGADVHGWDATDGAKWYTRGANARVFSNSRRRWEMPMDICTDGSLMANVIGSHAVISDTPQGNSGDGIEAPSGENGTRRPWPGQPLGALFSPDGRRVAFVCRDGVAVMDVVNAEPDAPRFGNETLTVGAGDVETMAFSPDGKRLILGGSEGGSGVWDISTRTLLIGSRGHPKGESPAVGFSPDGRRIAAGFASDGYTAVWEVPEGKGP